MVIRESELLKESYKPGEVAKMLGVTTRTVQNYCIKGDLGEQILGSGRRVIPKTSLIRYLKNQGMILIDGNDRKDIIYARVSTNKQKERGDLGRQIDKITEYVITKNPKNLEVHSDVGSGLNDNRRKLNIVLSDVIDGKVDRLFILYKDRLTRFGFNYLKLICDKNNTEIIIVSTEETNKTMEVELAEDIISIIHSFSGKLYGMRGRVKSAVAEELNDNK